MPNQVLLVTQPKIIVPTVDIAGAYADGDQVGAVQILSGITHFGSCTNKMVTLLNLQVIDRNKQNLPLQVFFFSRQPSLPGDQNPLDFQASDLPYCWGCTSVIECDYCETVSQSIANVPCQVPIQSNKDNNIYAVVKSDGTPTFTDADALQFRYYIAVDHS